MPEPLQDKIKLSLQAAEGLYHRLVLLVGESGSGKTGMLCSVADDFGTEIVNINLVLSAELLELTAKQRALHLPEIFESVVSGKGRVAESSHVTNHSSLAPVFLDNLEILFDKDLKQDPLRLLQDISRHRSVVASWNGKIEKGKLLYAEAGHPEYRSYDLIDTLIVNMDGTASID